MVSEPGSPNLDLAGHHHNTRFASRQRADAMEELSPESKVLYDMITAETAELYESKFVEYKKEILDAVRKFVDGTNK